MSQLGRISGQLLKDNLTRNGHDLTFDDDLLHLDVTGRKVGIKTTSPTQELEVNGTTKTTDLEVTNQADLGDITILGDTITSNTGVLNLTNGTGDHVAYQAKLVVDDITVENNIISTNTTDTNLEIRPNGTGTVDIYADTNIYGNVYVTGNIQADGSIIVGDTNTDNITINADVSSNIIPDANDTYRLGDGGTAYVETTDFTLGDVVLTVSSSGTSVELAIPAAGPAWVDALTAHLVGKTYQLILDGVTGTYSVTTLSAWTGTNPQTVTTTNDSLADGVYNVSSIRFDLKRWADLWVQNIYTDNVVSSSLVVDGIDLNLRQGNIYYVAVNGSDANDGNHQNDPFLTLKFALSTAVSGDTIYIYPGTYEEAFPLTVPVGVSVKGAGIRAVKIVPTTATRYNDAFLLNGETTVEDLTVADFFSGGNYYTVTSAAAGTTTVNVGIAPFAHTWVSGGTINISGTDYAISGATYTYTTGVLTVTHAGPDATGLEVFLSNLTFSCNGSNRIFPDNGYAFRFAEDFTVTSRSPYLRNITVLTKGSVTSVSDPLGFDQGDAGKGALINGGYATASSNQASLLFHSATFITPGVDCICMTNGVRVEWLNSFIYYANRGLYAYDSNYGFALQGKTRLKLPAATRTGTWAVSDTVSYYDTDGVTVLASGTIDSVDGDWINLTGKQAGFEIPSDRDPKTVTVNGDAKLSTAQLKFGTASLSLDGTTDYLSLPSQADFGFGTGDFCLEAWLYPTATGTYRTIFDLRSSAVDTGGIILGLSDINALYFFYNGNYRVGPVGTVSTNTWTHVALARVSGTTRAFVNGTQVGSDYIDANNYAARPVRIGADPNGNYAFPGYVDDVRISKGVGRYTTTFTAPTGAFLGDTSTVLLLHLNGTNNSTIITDDGVTFVDIRSSSGGTSTDLQVADYSDFGAEIRSIGSACVYGNYGVVGDGQGVIAYLIGQNLAYIGNGKETTNDPNTVIQANEVVELNNAKIYYQSVDHKGDFRIGDLFYVNQATGEVTFTNSNVTIGTSLTFDDGLGNVTYLDASKIETGDFRISGNTIETLSQDFNVTAASNQINLQSNVTITGNLGVTGNVTVGGNVIIGNESTDTVQFVAGVGSDIVPSDNNLYDLGTPTEQWANLYVTELDVGDIQITNNTIQTVTADTDLVLEANGTGIISIPTSDVNLGQALTVNGTTTLNVPLGTALDVTGTLTHTGNVTQTGDVDQTGDLTVTGTLDVGSTVQFQDIQISGNTITTTLLNNDLQLEAAGTGKVLIPSNDAEVTGTLTVLGTTYTTTINNTGTVTSGTFTTGDISISTNSITTTQTNSNLILNANGTGIISIPSNDVEITQNLTVNGTTTVAVLAGTALDITGDVDQTGNVTQTGDVDQTGDLTVTGTLDVGGIIQFQDIQISGNTITTTLANNDLVLEAAGTGKILIPSDNAEVTGTLTVVGTTSTTTINNTGTVTSGTFSTGDISINGSTITTTVGSNNLVLQAAGTGKIYIPDNDVFIGRTLTVLLTTTLDDTNIVGALTHTGDTTRTGNVTQTGNYTLNGDLTVSNVAQFKDINITDNTITTTVTNNNLIMSANGTGIISVPTNDVSIAQDLTVVGTTYTANIENTGTVTANTFTTGDISITGNTIQTTATNSNLQLQAAGTGYVVLEQFDVQENEIRINSGTDMVLTPNGTGIVNINSTQSIKIPVGTTLERPSPASAGMVRFNTDLTRYEGYDGSQWVRIDGVSDVDGNTYITAELTPGANDNTIRFVTNGTQVADLTSTRLNVINVDVDSININDNTISTTTTNTDLVISPNGTGSLKIGNFAFRSNVITNTVNNSITYFNQTGDGYVKINSTGGFVIPVGETGDRPALFELGMMRYNTTDQRVEIWDGSAWVGAGQGAGGGVTAAEAQDIGIVSAIIFG